MSIGEPPTWTELFDEVGAPEPVRVAIGRAIERINEVDESFAQRTSFEPLGMVASVDYAFRASEVVQATQWSPVFRSYFVESIAALAITRDSSGLLPLTIEDVTGALRDVLRVLEPLCAPA